MANHGVLIPAAVAATNVDSFNRSVVDSSSAPSDIDNGFVFDLSGKSTASGESEVFSLAQATTASTLDGMWMAYSGDEIVLTDARYKGLDPDPRHFFNAAGKVFSAYKPQVGDIIQLTAEALDTGAGAESAFAVAAAGSWKLAWAASVGAGLSYKYLRTSFISLGTGAIDTQRVAAYEFECVAN